MRTALICLLIVLAAAPVWGQQPDSAENPVLQFFFGWFPLLIIIVGWIWFMRRAGGHKLGHQVDKSLEHMDRVQQQNEEILQTLQKIEQHLRR